AAPDVAMPPLAGEAQALAGGAAEAGVDPARPALAHAEVELDHRVARIGQRSHVDLGEQPGLVEALERLVHLRGAVDLRRTDQELAADELLPDVELARRGQIDGAEVVKPSLADVVDDPHAQ